MKRLSPSSLSRFALVLFCLMGISSVGLAATLSVTVTGDSGAGSLRAQIAAAASGDTISFDPTTFGSAQTITLTSGQIAISKNLIILGPGADKLTISGNNNSRIFLVNDNDVNSNKNVTITDMTLTAGNGSGDVILGSGTPFTQGGAIYSTENLTLRRCAITANNCAGPTAGVQYGSGTAVTTNIIDACTFSGNAITNGTSNSGAFGVATANLTATNSTFSGNTSVGSGGAAVITGASAVTLTNCTVVGNTATGLNGGGGIRVNATGSSLTLKNTIVAGNTCPSLPSGNDLLRSNGTLTGNNNVIGDAGSSGGLTNGTNGNIVGVSGSGIRALNTIINTTLASNGGPTLTHDLAGSSVALNAGSNADASTLPSDQRGIGYNRFNGTTVDIGAVESGVTAPSFPGVQPLGAPAQVNNATTLTFTVPPGNNRLLIVSASASDLANATDITGVTFNGSAMTLVAKQTDLSVAVDSFWQTTLGTSTNATSATISVTGTGGTVTAVTAVAFQNVNQVLPINKINSGNNTSSGSSTRTISVGNSAVGDLVMDIFDIYDSTAVGTQTPGAGQAVVHNVDAPSGSLFGYYMTSLKPGDPAAVSTTYTSSGQAFISIAFNIKQAAVATPAVTVPGGTTTLTTTTSGTPGTSVNFSITGANLTGFPGNLTVSAPTDVQVSADNTNWSGTASIPYSSATLASTPVYVRLAGTGSVGPVSGNVSITGGGLSAAVTQPVSGTLNAAPTITSLNRVNASPSNAATVNWTLTFSSAVTGLTASNFSLSGAAATGALVGTPTIASGGGLTWNVPVTTGGTDGTLALSVANATGFSPSVSTGLPFTTAGHTYTMDKTRPTIVSINRQTPAGQNTGLTTVIFRVTYSEAVSGMTNSSFAVIPANGSNIVGSVTGVSVVNPTTCDVTVSITSGTGDFRLRGVN